MNTTIYKNYGVILLQLFNVFFNDGFYKIFKKTISRWRPLLSTSYNRGLEYWVFRVGLSIIDERVVRFHHVNVGNELVFNQYCTSTVMSNISLHNKYYRTVMMKFMQLLLVNWQVWKKNYNISFQFVVVNKNFHLIRYYNYYYFKMYNF